MKTPEDYEYDIFRDLWLNGDLIDDNFDRFLARNKGMIERRFWEYAYNSDIETRTLRLLLNKAEDRAKEAEEKCKDLDKGYLKLGLY